MSAIQANLDTMSSVVSRLRSAFRTTEDARNAANGEMNRLKGEFQSRGAREIYATWEQFTRALAQATQLLDQTSTLIDRSRQVLEEADQSIGRAARGSSR